MSTEPIDLDAAQALADAATPGPWRWGDDNDGNGNTLIRAGRRWDALANFEYTSDEDGDFICQARRLVPALIAELRESRAIAEDERVNASFFVERHRRRKAELDVANETLDRVRLVVGRLENPDDRKAILDAMS